MKRKTLAIDHFHPMRVVPFPRNLALRQNLINLRQLLGVQLHVLRFSVFYDAVDIRGSRDRDDLRHALTLGQTAHPRQCKLGGRATLFTSKVADTVDEFEVCFEIGGLKAREHATEVFFGDVLEGFDLAAQHTLADGGVAIEIALVSGVGTGFVWGPSLGDSSRNDGDI